MGALAISGRGAQATAMSNQHHISILKGQILKLATELSWDPQDSEEKARAIVLVASELLGAFQGEHSERGASAAWKVTLPAVEERYFLGHRREHR